MASIARLGRELGLRVMAEGIETPAQLELARKAGCVEGQGYLLGKPMTSAAFDESLKAITLKRRRV